MTEAIIKALEQKGFNRWQKNGMDRLYIHPTNLGLFVTKYKTGNISYAEFKGQKISHAQGGRLLQAKTFIDVNTDTVYSEREELAEACAEKSGATFEGKGRSIKLHFKEEE